MTHGKPAEGKINANFNVERGLWREAQALAAAEGTSLPEVLRRFLRTYTGREDTHATSAPATGGPNGT